MMGRGRENRTTTVHRTRQEMFNDGKGKRKQDDHCTQNQTGNLQ